jgi:CheY-like chemotaxis protein
MDEFHFSSFTFAPTFHEEIHEQDGGPMKTILLIDDCEDFRAILSEILLDNDYDIREASCPERAFQLLSSETVDLIICDLHMPLVEGERACEFEESHIVGIRTIRELAWVFPGLPIIALSAAPSSDLASYADALSPVPLAPKPISARKLLAMIESAFHQETAALLQ